MQKSLQVIVELTKWPSHRYSGTMRTFLGQYLLRTQIFPQNQIDRRNPLELFGT